MAKSTGLWLNRVLHTVEDYRLLHALPKFLEARRGLSPDTWRACLHVSNFPINPFLGQWGTWTTPSSIEVSARLAISPSPICGIMWSRSFTGMVWGF